MLVCVHGKLILVQYKTFLLDLKLERAGASCIPNHLWAFAAWGGLPLSFRVTNYTSKCASQGPATHSVAVVCAVSVQQELPCRHRRTYLSCCLIILQKWCSRYPRPQTLASLPAYLLMSTEPSRLALGSRRCLFTQRERSEHTRYTPHYSSAEALRQLTLKPWFPVGVLQRPYCMLRLLLPFSPQGDYCSGVFRFFFPSYLDSLKVPPSCFHKCSLFADTNATFTASDNKWGQITRNAAWRDHTLPVWECLLWSSEPVKGWRPWYVWGAVDCLASVEWPIICQTAWPLSVSDLISLNSHCLHCLGHFLSEGKPK